MEALRSGSFGTPPCAADAASPLCSAPSALRGGTHPVARRSRFHGCPGWRHFAPEASVLPPAPLTRLPPSVARLRRFEGGRTQWPGEAGSTGALDGGTSLRKLRYSPLRRRRGFPPL